MSNCMRSSRTLPYVVFIARDKNVLLGFTWPRPALGFQDDPPGRLSQEKDTSPGLEEDMSLLEENVLLGLEEDVLLRWNEATLPGRSTWIGGITLTFIRLF